MHENAHAFTGNSPVCVGFNIHFSPILKFPSFGHGIAFTAVREASCSQLSLVYTTVFIGRVSVRYTNTLCIQMKILEPCLIHMRCCYCYCCSVELLLPDGAKSMHRRRMCLVVDLVRGKDG